MWVGIRSFFRVAIAFVVGLPILLIASLASSASYEVVWTNADTTRAAKWVRLCDQSGCSRAVAVDCAAGATCLTRFDDPPPWRDMFVAVSEDGATWSLPSNAIDTTACLLSDACRLDVDRSGTITILDFGKLIGLLGTKWR